MPSFDTIAEWVLDNLYLAGGVTGAVLLLLLLVLLLILRGKRASGGPTLEEMFANRPTEEVDLSTPLTSHVDDRRGEGPGGGATVGDGAGEGPDEPPETPRPSPPPAAAIPFRPIPGAGDEHVRSVVMGLLNGRGELTGSELRRIELLRPEKVLAVLDDVEGTLTGRGKEAQRARFLKLRQYAELLAPPVATDAAPAEAGESGEAAEYVTEYVTEYVGASGAEAADARVDMKGDGDTSAPEETEGDVGAGGDRDLSVFPEEPGTPPGPVFTNTGWSKEGSADWFPGAPSGPPAAAPSAEKEPAAPLADDEPAAPLDQHESWIPETTETDVFPEPVIGEAVWTAPDEEAAMEPDAAIEVFRDGQEELVEESWDEGPEDMVLEEPMPAVYDAGGEPDEIPAGPETSIVTDAGSEVGAGAADAGSGVATAAEPEGDVAAATPPAPGPADLRIETAEEVLALREDERPYALDFLTPAELGRLFASIDDAQLKFAIIDIVSHEPDSDSIDVLEACLDDPDPEVQLHALEAAERLLSQE